MMKKGIIALFLLAMAFSVHAREEPADGGTTPASLEIDANIFGVILGLYQVKLEVPLANGLIGIGPRVTYINTTLYGALEEPIQTMQAVVDVRLYFRQNISKIYIFVAGGYETVWYEDYTAYKAIPLYTGLGYKWVFGDFCMDYGGGIGKLKYLGDRVMGEDSILDELPGFYGYFTFGYRF